MRPIKILGIAPYEGIASLMQQAAESCDDLQIDVHVGNLTAGAEIAAAQTAQEEYDVIREKRFSVKPCSTEEAILQMNLLGHNFFLYRNVEDGQVQLVYRRNDGNYGVLIPEG